MNLSATPLDASKATGSGSNARRLLNPALNWKAIKIMNLRIHRAILACILIAPVALSSRASAQANSDILEKVLTQMDAAAKDFHTLEASFVWDQYTKVVDETDTSKGKIYFKREGGQMTMAADIAGTPPSNAPKYIVFSDGEVKMYEMKIDKVTSYKAGKNRAEIESFLVLGFGGRGHDLPKSYDVKYLGEEKVLGVETEKLELLPKSEKMRGRFSKIILWIDLKQGISVQQQLFQPAGDFRLAKYSEVHLNQKLPDGVFKLKTTSKTQYLSPQG